MSILKVDFAWWQYFFQNSYSLVSKIENCLKYFLDKNSQKQPLWLKKSIFTDNIGKYYLLPINLTCSTYTL